MKLEIDKGVIWNIVNTHVFEDDRLTFEQLTEEMGIQYNFDNLSLDANKETFTFDILDDKKLYLAKIKYGI